MVNRKQFGKGRDIHVVQLSFKSTFVFVCLESAY